MLITKDNINDYKTVGRLGNQLFIIAAAYSLAKQQNCDFRLSEWKYANTFKNVPIGYVGPTHSTYTEPAFTYIKPILYTTFGTISLNGYFQSEKYFYNRESICDLFLAESTHNYSDRVGIHIRRGDYLQCSHVHNNLCNTEYYSHAIEHSMTDRFVVFSDDIEFCKQYLAKYNKDFIYHNGDEIDDLLSMSTCKGNIIANSSFSWWGAYLNKNQDKIIMPREWFTGDCIDSSDLHVKKWSLIK